MTDWQIPPSVRRRLPALPARAAVAVLLRHSVRGPLPPGDAGNALPITGAGARLARELGVLLGPRLRTLHTSPVLRCVQTAEALRQGAAAPVPIHPDRMLGDPGVYVVDAQRAWRNWQQMGHDGVMAHLITEDTPLPGMAPPDAAARRLVGHMLAASAAPGIHLFVSHDAIVITTAARVLGEPFGADAWPWYLEGAFFWQQDGALVAAYRDLCRPCRASGD